MTPIRVLLADDHAIVRTGLRALLEPEPDVEVVAEASTAAGAVDRCRLGDVDVVLMDLRFGGVPDAPGESGPQGGVEATRRIRALPEPPQVLVVTSYDTDSDILGAVEAGAAGYLLKDTEPDALLAAIRAAAAGEGALSPTVASALMGRLRAPRPVVSERELEVLRAVSEGLSNRQIAARLHLSEATVKTHLVHVFDKLEVGSRTAAVARARESGLL